MSMVQSLAPLMPSGFGANRPASSTLPVPTRRYEQFSQTQPPCIAVDTMTAGKAAAGRSSTRTEDECLRAAAAGAGDADAARIDVRQAQQEVEGADAVPGLQAHEALQAQLGRRRR